LAEFLTLKEVAKLLRIGERTTYELCRTGQLGGAIKVGGQWRIEREAFSRWVERGGGAAEQASRGLSGSKAAS
jgi:excisionase family DNA binding protein